MNDLMDSRYHTLETANSMKKGINIDISAIPKSPPKAHPKHQISQLVNPRDVNKVMKLKYTNA